jgi:hypothetical protein
MISSKREAKRIRKNRMLIGAITIFVMLGGGLGIFASNLGTKENTVPYNDFIFEATNNGWMVNVDKERFYFPFHPLEVESIQLDDNAITFFKESDNVLLSYDYYSQFSNTIANANYLFAENLAKKGYGIGYGFNVETEFDIPLINCTNASEGNIVIIFKTSNDTYFELEDYCIIGYSNSEEGFYKLSSRILFGLMNII